MESMTVYDLRATLDDARHLGWGLARVYENLEGTAKLERIERAIAFVATEVGLSREELFQWSNSKWGRWLCDALQDGKPPTRETARKYLTRPIVDRLMEEVGAAR